MENSELEIHAKNIRKNILKMIYMAQSGHPGGALSIADILTFLYFEEMNIMVENPRWEDRDRLVLSKGHAVACLYATLAEKGFMGVDELESFRRIDSRLQGHPDMRKLPGIDMSTGSLGQGLSVSNGMAIAGKIDNKPYRVYCILGDGEIEEGQIWEAAMTACHNKLDNLCVILDKNGLQIDGTTYEVMNLGSITEKFKSFGFKTIEINGHNYDEIRNAFAEARQTKGVPSVIIANTIKGKGVSYMENKVGWHGKAPNEEEYNIAIADIDNN